MAEARLSRPSDDYVSPLIARIAAIRRTILRNADERGWTIDPEQTRRSPYRPPHGAEALHLRRR